jgi:hypothetical protein
VLSSGTGQLELGIVGMEVSDRGEQPPAGGSSSQMPPDAKGEARPRRNRLRRSTLTAVANVLFGAGLVLLFVRLYRDASFGGPALLVAGLLLAGAIGSWIAAAQWGAIDDDVG